jgi:hypothetical protein
LRLVESRTADFTQILVYDISRWGRFRDSDEAAHYEFLCKRAGIAVHYCAEQFENDKSGTLHFNPCQQANALVEQGFEPTLDISPEKRACDDRQSVTTSRRYED